MLSCHIKLNLAEKHGFGMQAQAALSGQLVVARQQHADVCLQLQRDHAALQQAALQEHALQKVISHCIHSEASPHVGRGSINMLLLVACLSCHAANCAACVDAIVSHLYTCCLTCMHAIVFGVAAHSKSVASGEWMIDARMLLCHAAEPPLPLAIIVVVQL